MSLQFRGAKSFLSRDQVECRDDLLNGIVAHEFQFAQLGGGDGPLCAVFRYFQTVQSLQQICAGSQDEIVLHQQDGHPGGDGLRNRFRCTEVCAEGEAGHFTEEQIAFRNQFRIEHRIRHAVGSHCRRVCEDQGVQFRLGVENLFDEPCVVFQPQCRRCIPVR